MLESVIPRLLGWMPTSLRRALIGRPDNPSRFANIVHNLLNRMAPTESQVFDCHGVLEGYRMSIDWSRYRSFVYGTWEPKVIRAVTDTVKPGMTIIDIGAHIGYYSLLFAKCVGPSGRVFAFEPLPGNFALLQKNLQLNNLQNVHALNQAVFSRTQEITITAPDDQPNPGSGSMNNETGERHYLVEAISVDDFCEKYTVRPDILKMELDLGWATVAGQDPVELFKKSPGRFPLWHVKDIIMAQKMPTEIGNGTVDFKRIFASSSVAGMQYFFVEQDGATHPFESIMASYQDLTTKVLV